MGNWKTKYLQNSLPVLNIQMHKQTKHVTLQDCYGVEGKYNVGLYFNKPSDTIPYCVDFSFNQTIFQLLQSNEKFQYYYPWRNMADSQINTIHNFSIP